MFELPEIIGIAPADIFMIAFLIVLQILHVFWTYFLIKGILNFKKKGKVEKDERSDSDDSDQEGRLGEVIAKGGHQLPGLKIVATMLLNFKNFNLKSDEI